MKDKEFKSILIHFAMYLVLGATCVFLLSITAEHLEASDNRSDIIFCLDTEGYVLDNCKSDKSSY